VISWLFSQVWPYLLGLMALFGLYQRGRHNGEVKAARKKMQKRADTLERMANVESDDDSGVLREWLRERGQR